MKALTITANVSLTKSSPMVEVELTVDNTARDHRLRLMMPTGVDAATYRASQAFYVAERNVAVNPATLAYEEKEKHEKPMSGFAYKRQGDRGLCFVSGGGLHEVGAFEGAEGMLAVTLLRCFSSAVNGYVSADGQMQGENTFKFGLLPLTAADKDADIQRKADAFTAGVRYCTDRTWQDEAVIDRSFYRLEGENTVFSTLKVAEDGVGLCLRVFNMSDTAETATLTFQDAPYYAALVNLEECHPAPLPVEGKSVAVEMPAWAIRTVYLKF